MLIQEFEQRTGFFPTLQQYAVIEQAYYDFDGEKDAFCAAFKKNENGLAEWIQSQVNETASAERNAAKKAIAERDKRIKELEEALEREQEWRPHVDKDNVQQADYIKLREDRFTRVLSDDEAKDLLYQWFGFAREKIKIHHSVPQYEVNRHRMLRKVGEIERLPLYNATDWNYIRFDCGCMCYELQNDDLRPYRF